MKFTALISFSGIMHPSFNITLVETREAVTLTFVVVSTSKVYPLEKKPRYTTTTEGGKLFPYGVKILNSNMRSTTAVDNLAASHSDQFQSEANGHLS